MHYTLLRAQFSLVFLRAGVLLQRRFTEVAESAKERMARVVDIKGADQVQGRKVCMIYYQLLVHLFTMLIPPYLLHHPILTPSLHFLAYTQETLDRILNEAASVLRSGGVVALPTETVYGIASSAESSEGIEKLYRVKGRQKTKPIAICLNEVDDIDRCEGGKKGGREGGKKGRRKGKEEGGGERGGRMKKGVP